MTRHESILLTWPRIFGSVRIVGIVLCSVGLSVVTLYITRLLDASTKDLAFLVRFIVATTMFGVASLLLKVLIDWLCLVEERAVRLELSRRPSSSNSASSADLPRAIEALKFCISAPSAAFAFGIFSLYVLLQTPLSLAFLVAMALLVAYPAVRYSIWRRSMIVLIRDGRNRLLDEFSARDDSYEEQIRAYTRHRTRYVLANAGVGAATTLLFGFMAALCVYINRDSEHLVSTVFAIMFVLSSGNSLISSYLVFTEDVRSLNRVLSSIGAEKAGQTIDGGRGTGATLSGGKAAAGDPTPAIVGRLRRRRRRILVCCRTAFRVLSSHDKQ